MTTFIVERTNSHAVGTEINGPRSFDHFIAYESKYISSIRLTVHNKISHVFENHSRFQYFVLNITIYSPNLFYLDFTVLCHQRTEHSRNPRFVSSGSLQWRLKVRQGRVW